MSTWNSITELRSRNAIRRKRTGIKIVAEVYHCQSIDEGCREFFKSRGMSYGGFTSMTYGKQTKTKP